MLQPILVVMLSLSSSLLAPDQVGGTAAPRSVQWVLSQENVTAVDPGVLERWREQATHAQSELEEFDVRLASANWILSRQIAAPVSRLLLGIETQDDKQDIAQALARAQGELEKAEKLWETIVKSGVLPDAYDSNRAKNLSGIRIFLDVFNSLWSADKVAKEARDEAMRESANGLSILLQDDRKEVVAAAQLWQGYVYVQRGRLAGALELWPRTLEQISVPHGVTLYSRLMQCKTLVQKDQVYTAGVSLLFNLEQAAVRRISDAQKVVEAQAAIAFVRRQFFSEWRKKLTDEGELDRATWCSHMIETQDVAHDPGSGMINMLPLEFAAPEFVDIDKAITRLDEPAKREPANHSQDGEAPNQAKQDQADSDTNEDDDPPANLGE